MVLASTLAQAPAHAAADDSGPPPAAVLSGDWNFLVWLDGKPIGRHRFSVGVQDDRFNVTSDASFDVKLFGLSLYRYRYHSVERWQAGCLRDMDASTDDNGSRSSVQAERQGEALVVTGPAGRNTLTGCVMSFAYWNPALQTRTQLLNGQTGRYDSVRVSQIGSGSVDVRGRPVMARHLRITGPAAPIDLWISPQGEWVGLDATVSGGRKLSYRLD
jgi:hypothetical protein